MVIASAPSSSHDLPATNGNLSTKPTLRDRYQQYLSEAEENFDLEHDTIRVRRSHLRKMEHFLEISVEVSRDLNSEGMRILLCEMGQLFVDSANEGKSHRTLLDYQRFFVSVICKARESLGLPSDEFRKTLNKRLNRIRRPKTPAIQKPWSPEDEDVEQLYKYANDIIEGKAERPFGRYNAKTGEWTKRMPMNKIVMIRAAITVEAAMAGRTMEIRDIQKSMAINGSIYRVVNKKREPKELLAKIRPDLWKYVQAWIDISPKNDSRLFPYAASTFSNIISAFMRQAGWEARNLGLYALRRWGLSRLQENGKSDHVIMAVSQHQHRDSMRAYLSANAEQRMADEGHEELQGLLVGLIEALGDDVAKVDRMIEELKTYRNLFSADEVKTMMQMNDDSDSLGQERSDYLVERSVAQGDKIETLTFNLEDDGIVEHSNEVIPTLRNGANRFTQRIGNKLNSMRPIGPTVQNHGVAIEVLQNDAFIGDDNSGMAMPEGMTVAKSAEGRIRTCEPIRTAT